MTPQFNFSWSIMYVSYCVNNTEWCDMLALLSTDPGYSTVIHRGHVSNIYITITSSSVRVFSNAYGYVCIARRVVAHIRSKVSWMSCWVQGSWVLTCSILVLREIWCSVNTEYYTACALCNLYINAHRIWQLNVDMYSVVVTDTNNQEHALVQQQYPDLSLVMHLVTKNRRRTDTTTT